MLSSLYRCMWCLSVYLREAATATRTRLSGLYRCMWCLSVYLREAATATRTRLSGLYRCMWCLSVYLHEAATATRTRLSGLYRCTWCLSVYLLWHSVCGMIPSSLIAFDFVSLSDKTIPMWKWRDELQQWRLYDQETSDKLESEFKKRPQASCIITRAGKRWVLGNPSFFLLLTTMWSFIPNTFFIV